MDQQTPPKKRTAGFTIIELMISIAVGSLVLMMLMQMVVMNVTARRIFEYENYVTEQSLLITDVIRKNLNTLQPHRLDITTTATEITVTFTHEYDITIGTGGALERTENVGSPDTLVYNIVNETLTYNGTLLHATNIHIMPGSTLSIEYYEDTNPNPATCSDIYDPDICGDGILEMVLIIAIQFGAGSYSESRTFTTRIIV